MKKEKKNCYKKHDILLNFLWLLKELWLLLRILKAKL